MIFPFNRGFRKEQILVKNSKEPILRTFAMFKIIMSDVNIPRSYKIETKIFWKL